MRESDTTFIIRDMEGRMVFGLAVSQLPDLLKLEASRENAPDADPTVLRFPLGGGHEIIITHHVQKEATWKTKLKARIRRVRIAFAAKIHPPV